MEPRFVELLVRGGVVTRDQLSEAQKKERENGSSITREIVRLGYTSEQILGEFLAKQFGIETVDLIPGEIDDAVFSLVPPQILQKHQLVPYKLLGSTLTIAMSDPTDLIAINEVKFVTGYGVRIVLATPSAIKKTLDQRFGGVSYDDVLKKFGEGEMEVVQENDDVNLQELQQATMDAPVVTLVNAILADAAKRRCSDIHIEPYEKVFRVRFRIDGVLQEIMSPPLRLKNALVSRLKVMAGLDIAERRLTQDGRIKLKMGMGGELDIRVSILPTLFGEKVVMRLLDKSNLQLDMSRLGFDPQNLKDFQEAIHKPYGMILITGPTGSGKSTTLYSALSELNKPDVNISTAEDPVEFNLMGINQVQMKEQIGLNFAAALRAFLRQDPNIILVGEIRDFETAEIAIKAALTGHLVLSTLHTNDAPSTISRLMNMGIEPFLVATSVNLIQAQRLIRRVCKDCKREHPTPPEALMEVGFSAEDAKNLKTFKGTGCATCNNTGYKGRIGLYEVMEVNDDIRELILIGASSLELRKKAIEDGMITLRESGLHKVRAGLTTLDEVVRETVA